MPKPLLMLKMVNLKKVATKKKAPTKKKKKKIPKNPNPVRLSPFKVNDKVWVERYLGEWVRTDIVKCIPPMKSRGEIHWKYDVKSKVNGDNDGEMTECQLLPDQIFTLIASDVNKMKMARFADSLNKVFDADVMILEVYRLGQKKPWAYYVIPDDKVLWKLEKHKTTPYGSAGYTIDEETKVYLRPVDKLNLRLIPISSAPQEILTYLGLHIYSRKWVKHGSDQETVHAS